MCAQLHRIPGSDRTWFVLAALRLEFAPISFAMANRYVEHNIRVRDSWTGLVGAPRWTVPIPSVALSRLGRVVA
jgi:hypothetical protein